MMCGLCGVSSSFSTSVKSGGKPRMEEALNRLIVFDLFVRNITSST